MDTLLDIAVGPTVGRSESFSEGRVQLGQFVILQGNMGLFRALTWAIFSVTYYCAAAFAITSVGATFRRYKAFTVWCIAGIIGNILVLVEYPSALDVLIMMLRLCIFRRSWAVQHTIQGSLLLPVTLYDFWDSILGPLSRRRPGS